MPAHWWNIIKDECKRVPDANPFSVAAVMAIEMEDLRRGRSPWYEHRVGEVKGPCGFKIKQDVPLEIILNPELQMRRACWLLRGNLKRRLLKYNATPYHNNYLNSVLKLKHHLERSALDYEIIALK